MIVEERSTVHLWDSVFSREIGVGVPGKSAVEAAVFDEAWKRVFLGRRDGTVVVVDTQSGKVIRQWQAHRRGIRALSVSQDGQFVLSGAEDGTARVWEVSRSKMLMDLRGHRAAVTSVAFSPDRRLIATAAEDGAVLVFNWELGGDLRELVELANHRVTRSLTAEERATFVD